MAKVSKKRLEETQRLRYIRALERFYNSVISYLSRSDQLDISAYRKKIVNGNRYLDRVSAINLYQDNYNQLEKLVHKMQRYASGEDDIQKIKDDLLYSANQLEKSINARRYKKDKHTKRELDEWE